MAKVQLFAINPDGDTVLLQLSDSSPIKMNLSVAELNPFSPSSFYSQTFRVPAIGPNIKFFQDAYSVNGATFDPSLSADAWILNDGFLFSVGNLNLQNVFHNEMMGVTEYEVYFLGDTSDLSSSIGEGGMNTISTDSLNHDFSYAAVTGSWLATPGTTAGTAQGNVLYPLCEWGYTYSATGAFASKPDQSTLSHQYVKSFTNISNPLTPTQFKPAVKVKWLWDQIFEQAGYTYESDFIDSEYFDSLYMLSDSNATPTAVLPVGEFRATFARVEPNPGEEIVLPFDVQVSDPGNTYDPQTYTWTCPADGVYSINAFGYLTTIGFPASPQMVVIPRMFVNGTFFAGYQVFTTQTNQPTLLFNWAVGVSASFTKDDKVQIRMSVPSYSNPNGYLLGGSFQCVTSPADIINVNSFLPDETILKKIDFVKGITRMFNLVFEPTKTQQKRLLIEPWVDWITLGSVRDWTIYYDGASDMQSSAVFLDQSRVVKWVSEEDDDSTNKQYQEQYKTDYNYRQYDSGIKLLKGDNTIDIPFAPTPLQSLPSASTQYPNWVFPTLARIQPGDAESNVAGKLEPMVPKPRIVHYNGLQANPIPWYMTLGVTGGTAAAQNSYPLVSPYSSWPPNEFETINLNFQSKNALWNPNSTLEGFTNQDMYTAYYQEFINWLYDPFNRKVNLTMRIDPLDIQELRFNDRIWIKDTWYFIQSITDYPVGDTALVKLELVKVPARAIPGPIPEAATGPTGGTTCRSVSFCVEREAEASAYSYVDCDGNLGSISLSPNVCSAPICALWPLVNPLPTGFTAQDVGPCGETGADFFVTIGITGAELLDPVPSTTVTLLAATGGTAGTYIPVQQYNFVGNQDGLTLSYEIPAGYGARIELSSSLTLGATITSQNIVLEVNGGTVNSANRTGTYQVLAANWPSAVVGGSTYEATVNFNY